MHPQVTNAAMINHVLNWIFQQPFYTNANQQPNYTVGITENRAMIISKAGGVTSRTNGMNALADEVKNQHWWPDLEGVYFAQPFDPEGSNHGEMCVLAAADAMGERLVDIRCTGDNCSACATVLADAGVNSMNNTAPGTQTGWRHPRGRLTLGTQNANYTWQQQIAELHTFNRLTPAQRMNFRHVYTSSTFRDPKGKYELVG
jgi:hypothetical protein